CASIAAIGVLGAQAVWAQESAQSLQGQIDQLKRDFEAMKQQYGDRLTALETKMAALPVQPELPPAAAATPTPNNPPPPAAPDAATPQAQSTAQVPPGRVGAGGPSGLLPAYGAATAGSKVFNPDIAV